MTLVVQKYGGTSLADADRIRSVAKRVVATQQAGNQVVVCVSAMSGETNQLVALADQLGGERPDARELDVLVSTGEQKTIALLAMAIHQLGFEARSFTGAQMGMLTDSAHGRARLTLAAVEELGLAPGRRVFVLVKSVSLEGGR